METGKEAAVPSQTPQPRSVAHHNVKTSLDFRNLMSSIIFDVIESRITPQVCNAVCNASGKLLKMVDLEHKYGTNPERRQQRILTLAGEVEEISK